MTNDALTGAGWNFDNSYARLPEELWSRLDPTPVAAPRTIVANRSFAAGLGLNAEALEGAEGAATLGGNRVPAGAMPIAQAYAGHQFGHFTMLGDGRALLLGEQITPRGERFDIQLKGSGPTPFSRRGDGRAALGPMLREYIVSEAMHALGVPTTRSLAVVSTGEPVYRERELQGAILTRVASSHLRVGTFQFAAAWADGQHLRALADYALERHFPEACTEEGAARYLLLLRGVARRQAELIAKWQTIGFVHGVMNTDNMAIAGETIDYGPCAFLDEYDPNAVFSSIDAQGRYAYGNQPRIGAWNLARFAETLLPLLHEGQKEAIRLAEEEIAAYHAHYKECWLNRMRAKLGLMNAEPEDESLAGDLLRLMSESGADYTNAFRGLTMGRAGETEPLFGSAGFEEWRERWQARLGRQEESPDAARARMRASNPAVIPRNHRVEEALEAAESGDLAPMKRLLAALANPYAYSPDQEEFARPPGPSPTPYRTFCGT